MKTGARCSPIQRSSSGVSLRSLGRLAAILHLEQEPSLPEAHEQIGYALAYPVQRSHHGADLSERGHHLGLVLVHARRVPHTPLPEFPDSILTSRLGFAHLAPHE
jgi:hypothetical protein